MAPKSDTIEVQVKLDARSEAYMNLLRDWAKDQTLKEAQASEIVALTLERDSLARQLDSMSRMLAGQTLLNEELRGRVAWYRRLLDKAGLQYAWAAKFEQLMTEHRFNTVG